MIRKSRPAKASAGLAGLVEDTQKLVTLLVRENRALRARNQRLSRELDRVSAGWDEIRRLARSAPRKPRS
ncbi:MAG: hypothetical protein ACREPA_01925 [Candidatus Dormibacteraceae bacterium]